MSAPKYFMLSVLRRLDKAFAAFFRWAKAGQKPASRGFGPGPFDTAEIRVGDGLTLRKGGRLSVVGVPGEIRVWWHRPLPDAPRPRPSPAGRRVVRVFQVEMPGAEPRQDFSPVGIDLGLSSLVALSTGETRTTPRRTGGPPRGCGRRQRALARCRPRSGVSAKRKAALARYQAKVAARRRDHAAQAERAGSPDASRTSLWRT